MFSENESCSWLQFYSKWTPLQVLFEPFDHNHRCIQQLPPTAASTKIEFFVTLVTQSCIFDVAGVLDTPLLQNSHTVEQLFVKR